VLVQYDGDGQVLQQISLAREPAASVAFGGPELDQLLVLGAQGGLYGLPPDLLHGLAPGLNDSLFKDSGSASTSVSRS
jgi:L-arabinonolactonase